MNYKTIKILSDWPLSKVELVEIDGKKLILKTIHKDFAQEIERQKFLYENLKSIKIPKIQDQWQENGKVCFTMDYIELTRELNNDERVDALITFHNETKNLKNKNFSVYDFEAFKKELEIAKQYSPNLDLSKIGNATKKPFDTQYSMVHGDTRKTEFITHGDDIYLVDFGKSFYGPSLIDLGYYSLRNNYEIKSIPPELLKVTEFVVYVRELFWFHLCKTKYILDHNYFKEIQAVSEKLKWLEEEIRK